METKRIVDISETKVFTILLGEFNLNDVPAVKCNICKKQFYAKPYWLAKGWGKYCSSKCQYVGQRNGVTVKCFICGKEAYKTQKALKGSKSKKYFCGKSCQTIWRNRMYVGDKHPNWKDGSSSDVYRTILRRSRKPEVCAFCGIADTRVLAIHHRDHNHRNNRLKNLRWLCHNCHFLVHHYKDINAKVMADVA